MSRYLGLDHPGRVVAIHRTDAGLPVFTGDPADLAPEERAWLQSAAAWGAAEGAYAAMHRTKPQTAAFGLTDSPAGLAAWIVEKLRAWSDCDGDVERRFTKDEILTNVTLYWLTGTIGSSMRMYRANAAILPAQHARRVKVPSGFSLFPGNIVRPPRAWLKRTANVVRVTDPHAAGTSRRSRSPGLRAGTARLLPPLPGGGDRLREPPRPDAAGRCPDDTGPEAITDRNLNVRVNRLIVDGCAAALDPGGRPWGEPGSREDSLQRLVAGEGRAAHPAGVEYVGGPVAHGVVPVQGEPGRGERPERQRRRGRGPAVAAQQEEQDERRGRQLHRGGEAGEDPRPQREEGSR